MNLRLNPASVQPSPFYSHGVQVPIGKVLVQTAGQVGVDVDGNVAEGIAAQARQAMENVVAVLAEAGMTVADVVTFRFYLTEAENVGPFSAAIAPLMPNPMPATTMLVVKALASPAFLIEIEALAAR